MGYTKQDFRSGDILYASQLNAMDNQIYENTNAIADLLYKPIQINTLAANPSQVEIGSIVNDVSLEFVMNKKPTSATLDGTAKTITTASGSINLTNLSYSTNKTWTLVVTDERGASSTKNATLSFLNKAYWGTALSTPNINRTFILSLGNSVLTTTKARTINVNASTGEYIYYAIPSRFGACTFTVGGFLGGINKISTFSFTNSSGYAENYDVYRSDNANLGTQTVVIS